MIFHSYVSLPEGNRKTAFQGLLLWFQNLPATSYWTYRPISPPLAESSAVPKQLVKVKRLNRRKTIKIHPISHPAGGLKTYHHSLNHFLNSMESPQGIHKISQWLELLQQSAVLQEAKVAEKCATHICTYLLCYGTMSTVNGKNGKKNNHEPSLRNCMR